MDLKYDSLNTKYIFVGLSNGEREKSVYEISNNGNLLFRNYYLSSLSSDHQNIKFTHDKGIIASDLEVYNGNVIQTLFKVDSSYTILWKYQYDFRVSSG